MATPELRLARNRLTLSCQIGGGRVEWRELAVVARLAGGGESRSTTWEERAGGYLARCGPLAMAVRAVADGHRLKIELTAEAESAARVVELGLAGEIDGEWSIYSGYQSWDASGMARLTADVGASWWTVGVVGPGGALALGATRADRASTRFDVSTNELRAVSVEATGIDPEPVVWDAQAGERWTAEPIVASASSDVYEALRAVAEAVPGRSRHPVPSGWLSWYHYGPWVSADDVRVNAAATAVGPLAGLGYQVVQVDDGWQVAYGDWVENEKFPGGLRAVADMLAGQGQRLGVWTAPFLVSESAELARTAPESWFVRTSGPEAPPGRAVDPVHYVFGPMQVLDARNPEVLDHLESTFRRLRDSGVTYFKIDFLYAGAYASTAALVAGVAAIRRGIGDDAYLVACGAPLLPVVGICDGCRVGRDTATPVFDFEFDHPKPAVLGDEVMEVTRNQAARHHLSAWFQLDPDVALVGGNLDLEQARTLVTMCALSGGPFFASDDLTALPADRLELLRNREVLALRGGQPARPAWRPDPAGRAPELWWRDDVVAAFNWDPNPRVIEIDRRARAAVDLWTGDPVAVNGAGLAVEVPARGVRLLRLEG